jgi:hypothetical protein
MMTNHRHLLPTEQTINQAFELLNRDELYHQLCQLKSEIDNLLSQLQNSTILDRGLSVLRLSATVRNRRFKIMCLCTSKYELYEKLYSVYQLRILEEKKEIIKDFLENNPVVQKYRAQGVIRR